MNGDRSRRWLKGLLGLVLFAGLWLGPIAPAAQAADFCRPWHGQQICILKIQRSAKKHWEFRSTVSVNGVERPRAAYNCRRRVWVGLDGIRHVFDRHGPGELICTLLNKDTTGDSLKPELMTDRTPRPLQPKFKPSPIAS